MSTRSSIVIKDGDQYTGIYCHHDGYLSYVGTRLLTIYNTPEKVKELIALGDLSSLGTTINNDCSTYKEVLDKPTSIRPTDAYYRDINRFEDYNCKHEWDEVKPVTSEDIDEYNQDYLYIFDTKDNRWQVKYYTWNDFKDLETVCNDEDFLKEFYSQMIIEQYIDKEVFNTIHRML